MKASQYDEFENILRDMGYQIAYGNSEKYGNVLKLKIFGMSGYRRTYALGSEYTMERIEERILIKNKPLPVITLPEHKKIVISVRYFTKYQTIPLNPALRRYYRKLYQMGIKPKSIRRSYSVSKEAIQRVERAEQQLLCCLKYNIQNQEDVIEFIKQKEQELEQLKQEQTELYEKHEPYKKMMVAYKKSKKLMSAYQEYLSGDESKKQQAFEYEKQVKCYQKYGFKEEEIPVYQKSIAFELKDMNKRIKKKEVELEIAREVKKEYEEDVEYKFAPEEEEFCDDILEVEVKKKRAKSR